MGSLRHVKAWIYGLTAGCIGGGAQSLFSWLSLDVAHAAGLDVPQLNFRAMQIIFLSGVITHGMAYLMKSPLPKMETGDTDMFKRKDSDEDKS